mmetsp:Transcript_2313/g.10521  ORF Transcript_2313/g.10521 Transcript_2313/m.10521 type:complete len:218 (-) Transcript_2313:79-732(-)
MLLYGRPIRPPMLPTVTMRLHVPVITGTQWRTMRTTPKKLVPICASASAWVVAFAQVWRTVPALLMRTESSPCLAVMAPMHCATDSSFVTSRARRGCSPPPAPASSTPSGESPFVTLAPFALQPDRDVPYTNAAGNAFRSSSSMSLPRPLDAPVTRMTLGVSLDLGAGPNAASASSAGTTTMSEAMKTEPVPALIPVAAMTAWTLELRTIPHSAPVT